MSSVVHFSGGLSWWDGRWKFERLRGQAACLTTVAFRDGTNLNTEVTCKRCLAVIAKAAANQEPTDPEPELAREFFEGRGRR